MLPSKYVTDYNVKRMQKMAARVIEQNINMTRDLLVVPP